MRDGWQDVALSDVAEIVMGQAPPGDTYNGDGVGTPFIQGCAEFGDRYPSPVKACTAATAKRARAGDVLLSVRAPVGRINRARSQLVIGRGVAAIRGGDSVLTDYLEYALAHREPHLQRVSAGSTFAAVTKRDVAALQIPLPPVAEQRRIADLLQAMESAAEMQKRRVELSWDLLLQMTNKVMAAAEWPMRRLDEVAQIGGGITKGGARPAATRRTIPYLRVANVQLGRLDLADIREIEATEAETARHALEPGDVLLLEGGSKEDLGRGWVWSGELDLCLHQNHLHRARPLRDTIEPRFLAYAICAAEARAYCLLNGKQTSNLATINRTQIGGVPVRVPSLIEQRRVVGLLDALREEHDLAAESLLRLLTLRGSALDDLLSGARAIPDSYDRLFDGETAHTPTPVAV